MGTRFVTRPDGIPPLPYPLDGYGYVLVPGRRYSKLAHVGVSAAGRRPGDLSVVAFVERAIDGSDSLYKPDGWKKCGRPLTAAEADPLRPCITAARSYLDGTGPATHQARRDVEVPDVEPTVDLDALEQHR